MNPHLDIEIIKSALLAGDPEDAVSRIEHSMKKIKEIQRMEKSDRYSKYYEFLENLLSLLKGEKSLEEFRSYTTANGSLDVIFDRSEESKYYLESLLYFLEYSIDRYNIKYPAYDGKRCDDK